MEMKLHDAVAARDSLLPDEPQSDPHNLLTEYIVGVATSLALTITIVPLAAMYPSASATIIASCIIFSLAAVTASALPNITEGPSPSSDAKSVRDGKAIEADAIRVLKLAGVHNPPCARQVANASVALLDVSDVWDDAPVWNPIRPENPRILDNDDEILRRNSWFIKNSTELAPNLELLQHAHMMSDILEGVTARELEGFARGAEGDLARLRIIEKRCVKLFDELRRLTDGQDAS